MELAYPLNFASLLTFLAEGFSRGIALHWNPQNGCLLQMLQAVLFYSLLAFMSNIWTPSLFFSLSERKFTLLTCNSEFFKLHFNCNLEINWQKRLSKLTNSEKNICFQTYANVNVDSFFPGRQIHIYWLLDGIGQLEITTLPTRLALPRGKMTKSQCCWWLPPAQVPFLWSWGPYLLSTKRTRFTLGS